jgi:hypothetical protein
MESFESFVEDSMDAVPMMEYTTTAGLSVEVRGGHALVYNPDLNTATWWVPGLSLIEENLPFKPVNIVDLSWKLTEFNEFPAYPDQLSVGDMSGLPWFGGQSISDSSLSLEQRVLEFHSASYAHAIQVLDQANTVRECFQARNATYVSHEPKSSCAMRASSSTCEYIVLIKKRCANFEIVSLSRNHSRLNSQHKTLTQNLSGWEQCSKRDYISSTYCPHFMRSGMFSAFSTTHHSAMN